MKIVRSNEVEYKRLASKDKNTSYSISGVLSGLLESKDFFIHKEIIEPGVTTSAPHYHENTDEFIYVLKGQVTAHEEGDPVELNSGDCVCFQSGSMHPHYLENKGDQTSEVLIIKKSFEHSDAIFKKV